MAFMDHIDVILGALGGGTITQIANWGINKKKGRNEVKGMEIENIKKIVDEVYQPLINQQNTRIKELEAEVKALREERESQRAAYQKEVDSLRDQILKITKALGLSAAGQIRDANGRFAKKNPEP